MAVPKIVLNSGHQMPAMGFGTSSSPRPTMDELVAIIVDAIAAGYRHVDTAAMYGQEAAIGRAVAEAAERGLINGRDEVFVTSKLNLIDNHRDLVLPALKKTLSELKFDYVDLYLIHWPIRIKHNTHMYRPSDEDLLHFDVKEVWEAMEECYKLGLAKSIGVSNFSCAKLSKLLELSTIPPSVNQVEMNVAWQQQKLVQLCKEKNVCVAAYSPLGGNGAFWGTINVMNSPILKEIAASTNKTVAQVAMKWIVEQGAIPIVKSFTKERMRENLQVFNWELSDEDICEIRKIPQARACTGAPYFIFQDHGDYNTLEELWDGEM